MESAKRGCAGLANSRNDAVTIEGARNTHDDASPAPKGYVDDGDPESYDHAHDEYRREHTAHERAGQSVRQHVEG